MTHFPSPIKHEITSFSSVNDKLQCHGSFPKRKQCAKEAKVREVHRKRILQCQQNGITYEYSSSMRNGKMGAHGCW